jgi:hypothetical protein
MIATLIRHQLKASVQLCKGQCVGSSVPGCAGMMDCGMRAMITKTEFEGLYC